MLITLLSWLYITGVSLVWGNMLLHPFLKHRLPAAMPALPLLCFAGLGGIGITGLLLSLFIPLSLMAHLCILLPAIGYLLQNSNRKRIARQCITLRQSLNLPTLLLLGASMLVLLLISTHSIVHPDTLAYHAQAIHLMEQYKALPGIVHIKYETALTSWWFAAQALFRFNFIHANPYLFINGCVTGWFCLFVCSAITGAKNRWQFISWLLLLVYCFLSWTQLRLTAASASPDFITTLYIWGALYSLLQSKDDSTNLYTWLTVLFSCAAITLKLSAIVIGLPVLILLIQQLRQQQVKTAISIAGVSIALLLPYLVRNVIASGYPFFPSALGNWFPVDWKLNLASLHRFQHYITAYARFDVADYHEAEQALALPFAQWLPRWWQFIYVIDKLLMGSTALLLVYNLFTIKTGFYKLSSSHKTLLLVSLTGTIVWFVAAPAIRFGTGFLIPLLYSLFIAAKEGVVNASGKTTVQYRFFKTAVYTVCAALLLYSAYRSKSYFSPSQLVLPQGVPPTSYRMVNYQGVHITIADTCGFAPTPCTNKTDSIVVRGKTITGGFSAP